MTASCNMPAIPLPADEPAWIDEPSWKPTETERQTDPWVVPSCGPYEEDEENDDDYEYGEEDDDWDSDYEGGTADEDSVDVVPCPQCGAELYEDGDHCPACGELVHHTASPWSGKHWLWIALGGLGMFVTALMMV